jgi:uncharacterized protein YndB with AHSA1/START domain
VQRIELSEEIQAWPEAVWAVVTDHRGWSRWSGMKEAVLRSEGYPPPNGLGATRVFRRSGFAVEEEVTGFDPPQRMEYRLTAGLPIRDHVGEMTFKRTGSGTRLTWRVAFRPRIPGTGVLLRWVVARVLHDVLRRLAAYPFPSDPSATHPPAESELTTRDPAKFA